MAKTNPVRRYPRAFYLHVLILASLALMVAQLHSPDKVATTARWTTALFAPFFHAGSWMATRIETMAESMALAEGLRQENRQLRRDNAELALQASLLREALAKLEREGMLLHSPLPRMGLELIPANVIAGSSRQWAHTLKIDVGKLHGARREPPMPVVDYSGALAGLVVKVADTWSEVRLITDPGFAIGAIVEDPDNFEFREHGMITATDNPNLVRFRPTEPQRQRPRVGMPVISSGFEGSVYPKGLLIGYISQSHSDKYGMAYAEVEPAARFDSLEEVILIDMQPLGPAPKAAAPPTPAPAATPLEWTAVSIDEPAPAGTYENPLRLDDLAPEASDGGSLLDLPETGADLQTVR